jgi:flavin-dependent dehydrogenase
MADWNPHPDHQRLELVDGSKVAVIGGGPAGSFTSYFLLEMAERVDLEIEVEIYEPRDFSCVAPGGCNMCGGIISETLVQNLAAEGINLPDTVVQRGIQSYVLHMDVGTVRIETPADEKRIGAVYRGAGPRDIKVRKWGSFDHHLETLAIARGARVTRGRVDKISMENGRPTISVKGGEPQTYDLLVAAVGVNSPALKLFKELDFGYVPPQTTKTFIREYYLGEEVIAETLGDSMHVFLLNIPRLEFAAIIPKGDYASVCLLGEEIDKELVDAFLGSKEVKKCMPDDWVPEPRSCQCSPKIAVRGAIQPFGNRIVFVGDCGVTRLYKDGIGAAYRTAKACATTAVFEGVSEEDFRKHYWPILKTISRDNAIGKVTFSTTKVIQMLPFARRAMLRMTQKEQSIPERHKDISQVLWDMFTGSAPYKDIFIRTLHPRFLGRLSWELLASVAPSRRSQP